MEKNKKLFPKIKKQLKNFLTDESGEITKKDALGLAAGAAILASVDDVSAGHTNNYYANDNKYITPVRVQHVSGVVNGHISQTPGYTGGDLRGHCSVGHTNYHSSHGSGGWC